MTENTQKFLKDVMENTTKSQSAARNIVNICISKNYWGSYACKELHASELRILAEAIPSSYIS